jgi:uncharacterized protein
MGLEEQLSKFECQRCHECCKKPGFVYLNEKEEEGIAAFLKLSVFDFVNQFCELLDRRQLVLKKLPNEHCIFLSESGCQIHPAKPQQCRDFPVKWRTPASLQYCAGIQKLSS